MHENTFGFHVMFRVLKILRCLHLNPFCDFKKTFGRPIGSVNYVRYITEIEFYLVKDNNTCERMEV